MNGPCLISFPMYNKDSVRMWDPKEGDEKSGHAMVIVGYNETGFIIKIALEKNGETMVIVNIHIVSGVAIGKYGRALMKKVVNYLEE